MAFWYSRKAKLCWREGEKYFEQFRYPECVAACTEAIEFGTKSICEFLQQGYHPLHDISDALLALSKKNNVYSKELSRASWVSSRWVGMNQSARNLVRYGNHKAKIPATEFVSIENAESIRNDAEEICEFLNTIELRTKFKRPIRLGILDGHIMEDPSEKPCDIYPWIERIRIDDWQERFSQIRDENEARYNVERIPISRLTNEFAVIINPFGEAYPEKDVTRRDAFRILKDYIADGGILVNTAGLPFFWAWDILEGKQEPIVDIRTIVPESIKVEDGKFIMDKFKELLNFAGSLFWRDFQALTTSDTKDFSEPSEVDVYQTELDKKVAGDLTDAGGSRKIWQFRTLRKQRDFIPLLRASLGVFGEIYPIAAIRHGWGYLITAGMTIKGKPEFEKLSMAIDNFCRWLPEGVHSSVSISNIP